MKTWKSILAILMLVTSLAGCRGSSTNGNIAILDPWIRAVGAMEMSTSEPGTDTGTAAANREAMQPTGSMIGSTVAAFMTIKNNSPETEKLISVSSDVADAAEIHLSEMKEDVMTMRPVDGVEIPPRGEATLQSGSYHIMLIGLNRELVVGEKVNLTLTFEKAGPMDIQAEVRPMP